jgi:palmitoyltransferase ZDHHC9/14/18
MTGPSGDSLQNIFTWLMILGVSLCFFVICAPYIWSEIHWVYVVFIILLFISTVVFLFLTQVNTLPIW